MLTQDARQSNLASTDSTQLFAGYQPAQLGRRARMYAGSFSP